MTDLASVVPAPRFADTVGYYLIKICNPRENFESFLKNHPAKILYWAPEETVPWDSQHASFFCFVVVVMPQLALRLDRDEGGKQTKDCRILVSHVIDLFPIPPGKAFLRRTWTFMLLPEK